MSTPSGSKLAAALRAAGRLARELIKRSYAVLLIVIILWLSWLSVYYLVSSLMLPARAPSKIVDIPTRLNESALMRSDDADKDAQATANPRSPLSHYHRLDAGFQSDRFNGCTISGCHSPLPHGRNKGDRAFLNMHATSMHCGVCHIQNAQSPLPLAWYDLKTGGSRDQAPALLRAFAWLTSPAIRGATSITVSNQTEIVKLLRAAADESYGNAELVSLAHHLGAVRATSDEFTRLVKVAGDTVRGHFRGEYGAKLALTDPLTKKPILGDFGNKQVAKDFLARRKMMSTNEQALALEKIHPQRRVPTLHCTGCHRPESNLVNFPSLGYPPARIQTITSPQVTDAIDHIVEGKTFRLPDVMDTKSPLR